MNLPEQKRAEGFWISNNLLHNEERQQRAQERLMLIKLLPEEQIKKIIPAEMSEKNSLYSSLQRERSCVVGSLKDLQEAQLIYPHSAHK